MSHRRHTTSETRGTEIGDENGFSFSAEGEWGQA